MLNLANLASKQVSQLLNDAEEAANRSESSPMASKDSLNINGSTQKLSDSIELLNSPPEPGTPIEEDAIVEQHKSHKRHSLIIAKSLESISKAISPKVVDSPTINMPVSTATEAVLAEAEAEKAKSDLYDFSSKEAKISKHMMRQTALIFAALRDQQSYIEFNYKHGQSAVIERDQMAFFMQLHQLEISNLNEAHAQDIQKLKEEHSRAIAARDERKKAKKQARANIRGTKRRDMIIQQQEKAAHAAARVRDTIAEKRKSFDSRTVHMHHIHDEQRKNLITAQERYYENEKLLVDLETQKMTPEVRNTHMKKFQVRQNHRAHLNKRINDNLREVQLLQIQQAKEVFELEMVSFEELANKRIVHEERRANMRLRQMNEMHAEKEAVQDRDNEKKKELILEFQGKEYKRLLQDHRIELKQLKIRHQKIVAQSSKETSAKSSNGTSESNSIGSSQNHSLVASKLSSKSASRQERFDAELEVLPDSHMLAAGLRKLEKEDSLGEEEAYSVGQKQIPPVILKLMYRHHKELEQLESQLSAEINDCMVAMDAKSEELSEQHDAALAALITEQEIQLKAMQDLQNKEILYEETMHDNEMKMLIERRILNSVLQTVNDGIICITPAGTIVRFNLAAEKIFLYKAAEVLGKNVKMLVPAQHAVNHDQYLQNYLTTGIRKVIGIGRKVPGLKKDGSQFPLHLSLSEVKEYGEHLFTGIVHDLTEEVAEDEKRKEIEEMKENELKMVIKQLDVENENISSLMTEIMPPLVSKQLLAEGSVQPQVYKRATVMYFDIAGFTAIASQLEPNAMITMMNQLYHGIDSIIDQYDCYKVETVGDRYMVASGVPNVNKNHAHQIADLALHLVKAVDNFKFKPKPELKFEIRVGIHSGMVVAGLVGDKQPKYCLMGETVMTALKMEDSSKPSRIHISDDTYKELKSDHHYCFEVRGPMEIKSKDVSTYWLESKDNFNPQISAFE